MPFYQYKAFNNSGIMVKGEMEFADRVHLLNKLSGMGYHVSSLKEKRSGNLHAILEKLGYSSYRISRKSRIVFTRQMASLLDAGIPINNALTLIRKQNGDKGLSILVQELKKSIEGGSAVSEALSGRRDVFSDSYISMVEAGEVSGMLAETFNRLADLEEAENDRAEKVKAAVSYPVILLIASLLGINFLMIVVFPTFIKIFDAADIALPFTTRTTILISRFMRENLILIAAVILVVVLILRWYNGTEKGRYFFDDMKLRIPVFGPLFLKSSLASFSHTYQSLNSSGIAISQSLGIIARAMGNSVVKRAALKAKDMISDGGTIAESFSKAGSFPPLVVHMVSIGEESGNMDEMLGKLSEYYEKEIGYSIARLTTVIEPVLIAAMGLIIAFMYLSLITPMMQMMKVAKGGGL